MSLYTGIFQGLNPNNTYNSLSWFKSPVSLVDFTFGNSGILKSFLIVEFILSIFVNVEVRSATEVQKYTTNACYINGVFRSPAG